MHNFTPISALIGGALIGLSAVWMMAMSGRIAGISGILGGAVDIKGRAGDKIWRLSFLLGLIIVPFIMISIRPEFAVSQFKLTGWPLIIAGLFVGIGTQMGSGCTSGHGVCGNARFSARSLVATLTFMAAGILTVFVARYFGLYL